MSRATARGLAMSYPTQRRRWNKLAQFLSPGRSQREHTFLESVCLRGNDGFPRWKSLFFYRCTDVISFAPLRSQGAEPRLSYIRQNTAAKTPPPCSPKSIYVLAALVRLILIGSSSMHKHVNLSSEFKPFVKKLSQTSKARSLWTTSWVKFSRGSPLGTSRLLSVENR